jgi:hemolysin III
MEQAFFDYEHQLFDTPEASLVRALQGPKGFPDDGRLFANYPLYSEGMRRPKLRGVFHAIASFVLLFALSILLSDCKNSLAGQITSTLYICSKLFCYTMSALFHIFSWSPKTEILLQKLDHCAVAINSTGTILPAAVFLLGKPFGVLLMFVSCSLCGLTIYRIFQCRPSVVLQMAVAVWWVPFFWYPFYLVMTRLEFICMVSVVVLKGLGTLAFVMEAPDPIPDVFGYHEIFHTFVVAAGACIFTANWSIIHRFCADEHLIGI